MKTLLEANASVMSFIGKIPHEFHSSVFEVNHREAYESIIPKAEHKAGKDLTYYIEGFNTPVKAGISRL